MIRANISLPTLLQRGTMKKLLSFATFSVLALSLAACGGGGTNSGGVNATNNPVASEKEFVAGTVTGFGSVIVEGVRYDDSTAKVQLEYDPAAPKAAPVSDIKLGMQLIVKVAKAGFADSVVSGSEVLGPITSLATDGFVVAGQTIKISNDVASPTVFDGVANLAGLAVNDRVEVHGARDANNNVVATRIERKNPNDLLMTRVVGPIAALNTTAKTFTVGGLIVSYSDTTKLLPANVTLASLANGQVVAVFSSASPTAAGIVAKTIAVKKGLESQNPADADKAWVGGHIRDLNFASKTFNLKAVSVDASAATFSNGTASDLANARKVRVTGVFQGGVLKATDVKFAKAQGDALVELIGPVSSFVSSKSFLVRGVPVDASSTGVVFTNGTITNLGDGVAIKLKGAVVNDVVIPTSIEFVTTDENKVRSFVGEVQNFVVGADTFKLMGVNMKLAATATFKNSDQTASQKSEFGNTDKVQVRGAFEAGVFVVTEVVFGKGLSAVVTRAGGGITTVDGAAGVFKINGTIVRTNTNTTFNSSISNLKTGAHVEVEGTLVNGELVARKIEFQDAEDNVKAAVRGEVSDFVAATNFRLNGQKVNAANAVFENGKVTNLANGIQMEAKGKVVDGILIADVVKLK
jgi:Domain of unknown function (DUF5666)